MPVEEIDSKFDSLTGDTVAAPATQDTTVSFETDIPEDLDMDDRDTGMVGAVAKGGRPGVDISEVYSAPRVAAAAARRGLVDGYIIQKTWDDKGLNVVYKASDDVSREGSSHPADDGWAETRHVWPNQSYCLETRPNFSHEAILALHTAVMMTIEGIYAMENDDVGELPPEETEQDYWLMEAWDDIHGKKLDPKKVRTARREEIGYYYKMKMHDKVPISECLARTGQQPIGVRWIDHNKGDDLHELYRSRLVAQQFNSGPMEENIFAATPPLEALRMVISNATTGKKNKVIMIADVSRAYMYARIPDDEYCYVKLCEEDQTCEEDRNMCGRLRGAMYGTRKASQYWQSNYTNTMAEAGFETGKASPCTFKHYDHNIMCFVHGDDCVASGELGDITWMRKMLEAKYNIKVNIIGEAPELEKEGRILNRIIRWHPGRGVSYEADPRHAEEIIKSTGAADLKGARTPLIKAARTETEDTKAVDIQAKRSKGFLGKKKKAKINNSQQDSYVYGSAALHPGVGEYLDYEAEREPPTTTMSSARATEYRSVTARANFLSSDRADIVYAVKECARCMSDPTEQDWAKLVRLGRYLKARPRLVIWYEYQDTPHCALVYSDIDWPDIERRSGPRLEERQCTGHTSSRCGPARKPWSRSRRQKPSCTA